jgi:hypothetical protein
VQHWNTLQDRRWFQPKNGATPCNVIESSHSGGVPNVIKVSIRGAGERRGASAPLFAASEQLARRSQCSAPQNE